MAVVPALFGLLLAGVVTAQVVDISPREAVRRAGEELKVLCKASYKIDSCRILVGSGSFVLKPNNQDGDIVYWGRGLETGECGAIIRSVRDDYDGKVSCVLPPLTGNQELTTSMRLIVARAPLPPSLQLSPQQASFKAGDTLEAQCQSRNGRPAANLSWFLDEEPILQGLHAPVEETDPAGLTTITQNITMYVKPEDSGRKLVCRATHYAFTDPKDVARQIIVNFPPSRVDGEGSSITIFGLKLGEEGRLNVTIRASPVPTAEWTIGGETLPAPAQSNDGTITALQPVALGNNLYNVSLLVSRVSKEDTERAYYLRVRNNVGQEDYAVTITTQAEPAGVELDAGAVVGIVVAVLALLIAVSLVVFARATHRWCFAARNREPKSSGESSDTESATASAPRARLSLGALGARMRAALPKARDKVTTAEDKQQDDKPSSEDKKGVVYAELALGESERPPAPAPTPADYAEIVYTEGDKTAKE